jgi:hypothetical protein
MTDGFDRVLIELDFGSKAEAGMRCANGIASMEDLLLTRSDLAFGQLDFVQPYDQLRLYVVTEWVRKFGLGNRMLDFNEKDFNKFSLASLSIWHKGPVASVSVISKRLHSHAIPYLSFFLLLLQRIVVLQRTTTTITMLTSELAVVDGLMVG